ncbi:MAG: FoF1 ATP synthase subunit gamma [Rhodanobacteraceae bacterium]
MTETLEVLTRRSETLRSIGGIVRTMKTMSVINANPYEQASRAIGAYRATVLEGLHAFVQQHGPLPPAPRVVTDHVIVVFGSDHGLCGNYNEVIATEVSRHAGKMDSPDAAQIICVGAQMEDALVGLGMVPGTTLLSPTTTDGLGRLAALLVTRLDEIRRGGNLEPPAVVLAYSRRSANGQQVPVTQALLPLDPELTDDLATRPWQSRSLPQSTLPASTLLAALIRGYLFASLFRAAAEALVTENAARLARMQQAEKSVSERLEELTAETRAVRQDEITTELLDVIIGFEALKDREKRKRDQLATAGTDRGHHLDVRPVHDPHET